MPGLPGLFLKVKNGPVVLLKPLFSDFDSSVYCTIIIGFSVDHMDGCL
jgi:hypothetical protein